jgi:predicted heme/steroid binding protein
MIVGKASNASEATSSKTLGLIAQDLSINAKGFVITEGLLSGLNTMAAGTEGDPVWLGTDGNLIYGLGAKPYAPDHLVFIGIVTRKNANNGEIFVKVQNGFELQELHNVQITSTPSDNTVLAYETSTSLYKMKSIPALLGYTPTTNARTLTINGTSYDLSADRSWSVGTHTGNLTTGYVPKATGATTLTDSIIYDNGSGIGINTNSPYESSAFKLDVNGGVIIKNTSGTAAQLILINSNPATGGNNGFVQLSAGGNTATAFGQWQTYYGMSVASGALRLQPAGGQVLIGTTTTSAFTTDINGTLRVSGQLTLGSTISNNTYVYTMPGASGTLALVSQIPSLSGYVQTSRTLTINGVSYDLSADRSWSIATGITSATAGNGISIGGTSSAITITNTGVLTATASNGILIGGTSSNITIANTGVLTAAAGNGISIGGTTSNITISNTGVLTATASNGISIGGTSSNITIANTGILTATAGNGISVSVVSGGLTITNTINNTNQLTNGAGYITGITSSMVTSALGYTPYNSSNPNGYISSYTETDTLASVTGRGASTSTLSNFNAGLTSAKTSKTAYGVQIKGAFYGAPRLQLYDLAVDSNAFVGLGVDMSGAAYEFSNYFPRYAGNGKWSVGSWAGDFGTGQYVSGYNEKFWITESASALNVPITVNGRITSTSSLGLYVNSGGASYIGINSTSSWAYASLLNNGTTTWDLGAFNGGNFEFRPYGGDNNRIIVGLNGVMYFTDTTNGVYKSGGRFTVRSESTDNVANFASYGLYLPVMGQTAGLYVESPIEARGGLRMGNNAGSGTITVGATTGATADRLVQRDSGGDIYSRYSFAIHFNASCANNENPSIGGIWANSTSDNYLRKSTPAHFISQLGLITTSNYSSYSLPLSGGIMTGALVNNTDGAVIMESNASENNNWLWKEAAKQWGLFWFNRGTQSGQTIGSYTTVGAELMFMGGSSGIAMPTGWTGYIAGSNIAAMISNWNGYIYSASTVFAASDMRTPIFYDSADTSFYLDPNSYSRLSRVGVGGAANDVSGININGDAGLTGANFFYFGHNNGSLGSWQTRTFASGGRQIWNTNGFEVNRDGYGGGLIIYSDSSARVGFATSDFSYTASDNTAVVSGGISNNRVFVNGSIQLLNNADAIVIGRGTSTFLKDEELGFGWGGGWYMVDGTWLRVRNDKAIITGGTMRAGNYENYYADNAYTMYTNSGWGGWARNAFSIRTDNGIALASFGGFGSGTSLSYSYIGTDYLTTWIRFSSSAVNSQVALQQGGNQVLHAGNFSSYAVPSVGQSGWNSGSGVINNVVGLLSWKNYSNGHVIFDASNSTTPSGTSCSNTNPQNNWTGTYPTLMGWNGSNTYGVRVDSARYADSAGSATDSSKLPLSGGTMTGNITLRYSTANADDYNAITFAPGSNDYIIKASTTRGVFGRSSFGWHVDTTSAFGVYSNGWTKLFGVEGGSGNTQVFGNLSIASGIDQDNLVGRPYAVWGASGGASGPVVIKFPGGTGNYGMIHAVIDIYEYSGNHAATVIVGGHNWNGAWYNFGAQVIGFTDKPVRVGVKDGKYCIVIGNGSSGWSYGQVILRKIQNGTYYKNVMNVSSGYTAAIESDSYSWISGDLRGLSTPSGFYAGGTISSGSNISSSNNVSISGTSSEPIIITGAMHKYITINPGNGWEAMVRYIGGSGSSWYVGKRTSGQLVGTESFHFYSEAAGATVGGITPSGVLHTTGGATLNGQVNINRHIDANTSWGSCGCTSIFVGWGGAKVVLGNGNSGGHDYANGLGSNTVVSTNPFFCYQDITAYSDSRVKENVEVIEDAIEKVKAIRGVTFTRNDVEDLNKRHTGVIAQEILEVLPEAVSEDSRGHLSVAYGNLTSLLIEAIKEQQLQIEKLQNKLDNVLSSR